jgi:6 kDa early secretory antigenic target
MTDGGIRVNHGQLDNIATEIGSAVKAIDGRLDQMENAILKAAGENWTGEARNAFETSRTKWNTALSEMAALLNKTGAQVSISNTEYHSADVKGANALTIG